MDVITVLGAIASIITIIGAMVSAARYFLKRHLPTVPYQPPTGIKPTNQYVPMNSTPDTRRSAHRLVSYPALWAVSCGAMLVLTLGMVLYTHPGDSTSYLLLVGDLLAFGVWSGALTLAAGRARAWTALLLIMPLGSLLALIALYNVIPNSYQYVALEPPFFIACSLAILFGWVGPHA